MDNKIDKKKLLLSALLKCWLESEFLGLFVFLFFWAVSKAFGLFGNILFGVVGIVTMFAVTADFGLKEGNKAFKKVSLHGAEPCRDFGLAIGAVASIPCWLSLLLLGLSKLGVLPNILPAYKIMNAYFFPIIDIPAHTADVAEMHPACFTLFLLIPVIFILSGWISFRWGYDQVDLKSKLLYKEK